MRKHGRLATIEIPCPHNKANRRMATRIMGWPSMPLQRGPKNILLSAIPVNFLETSLLQI
jgi:hypothetical protein